MSTAPPRVTLLAALLMLTPATANAQLLSIDGTRLLPGDRIVSSMWTAGQTFTPLGASLVDFSFWFGESGGPGSVDAFVGLWDTSTSSVSSVLWSSPTASVSGEEERITFGVGGLLLDPSLLYVAFLTSSDFVTIARTDDDAYSGGLLVQTSGAATDPWNNIPTAEDSWGFRANFRDAVSVPEPGTALLLLTGVLGLLLARSRRPGAVPISTAARTASS